MFYYIIKPGDTYYGLSTRFGVSVQDLIAANPHAPAENLQPGQLVAIPTRERIPRHTIRILSPPDSPKAPAGQSEPVAKAPQVHSEPAEPVMRHIGPPPKPPGPPPKPPGPPPKPPGPPPKPPGPPPKPPGPPPKPPGPPPKPPGPPPKPPGPPPKPPGPHPKPPGPHPKPPGPHPKPPRPHPRPPGRRRPYWPPGLPDLTPYLREQLMKLLKQKLRHKK